MLDPLRQPRTLVAHERDDQRVHGRQPRVRRHVALHRRLVLRAARERRVGGGSAEHRVVGGVHLAERRTQRGRDHRGDDRRRGRRRRARLPACNFQLPRRRRRRVAQLGEGVGEPRRRHAAVEELVHAAAQRGGVHVDPLRVLCKIVGEAAAEARLRRPVRVPPARGPVALPQRGGDRVHRRWRRALREAKVALAVQAAVVVAGGVDALGGVRRREALRRVAPDDGAPPARVAQRRAHVVHRHVRRLTREAPPESMDASAADHRRAARCAACDVRRRVQHRSRILLRRAEQHLRVGEHEEPLLQRVREEFDLWRSSGCRVARERWRRRRCAQRRGRRRMTQTTVGARAAVAFRVAVLLARVAVAVGERRCARMSGQTGSASRACRRRRAPCRASPWYAAGGYAGRLQSRARLVPRGGHRPLASSSARPAGRLL